MNKKQLTQRQEQAAETRQRLLTAARELFSQNSYSATSVRAIHRAVGKADGTLYHYFPGGKEELLWCLLQEEMEAVVHEFERLAERLEPLPLEEALEQIYRNAVATLETHGELLRILCRDEAARNAVAREQLEGVFQHQRKWFPDFLRARAEAGEIQPLDYDSAAVTMLALMRDHFFVQIAGLGSGCLSNETRRHQLVQFHVNLWKKQNI